MLFSYYYFFLLPVSYIIDEKAVLPPKGSNRACSAVFYRSSSPPKNGMYRHRSEKGIFTIYNNKYIVLPAHSSTCSVLSVRQHVKHVVDSGPADM